MTALELRIYAKANMFNNGKAFSVIHTPDWNGGHFIRVIPSTEVELGDFEYLVWKGTPMEFATQKPVFLEYTDPKFGGSFYSFKTFFGVPYPQDEPNKVETRSWNFYYPYSK